MSDKCFMCRKNTRISKCDTCSAKCHHTCWNMYITYLKDNKSTEKVRCPQCHEPARNHPVTRSITKNMSNNQIIQIVKEFIFRAQSTSYNERIIVELFEYLLKNMLFVKSHNNFEKIVRNKLIEFNKVGTWDYSVIIYQKMFNENIPTEYF